MNKKHYLYADTANPKTFRNQNYKIAQPLSVTLKTKGQNLQKRFAIANQ